MKHLAWIFIVFAFHSGAKSEGPTVANVKLIDIDNEVKSFAFYSSNKEKLNLIPSKIPGTFCDISFVEGKTYVELGCVPSTVTAKTRFTRTFIRIPCDGVSERVLIVNTAEKQNAPMQGISITATCK